MKDDFIEYGKWRIKEDLSPKEKDAILSLKINPIEKNFNQSTKSYDPSLEDLKTKVYDKPEDILEGDFHSEKNNDFHEQTNPAFEKQELLAKRYEQWFDYLLKLIHYLSDCLENSKSPIKKNYELKKNEDDFIFLLKKLLISNELNKSDTEQTDYIIHKLDESDIEQAKYIIDKLDKDPGSIEQEDLIHLEKIQYLFRNKTNQLRSIFHSSPKNN